jgi:hypothetical protein
MGAGSQYSRLISVVCPTERRRVVTIDGQVTERDAAEVLGAYTLAGFGLGIDPSSASSCQRSSTEPRWRSGRAYFVGGRQPMRSPSAVMLMKTIAISSVVPSPQYTSRGGLLG